jgi:hypothetical protein
MERTGKRKRTTHGASVESSRWPSHLPEDSINPFSRPPSQLFQFSVAGLADTDEDPAERIPGFPHRGLARESPRFDVGADNDNEEDEDGVSENENDVSGTSDEEVKHGGRQGKLQAASHRERHFYVLLQSIHHFLDHGKIAKAARAYGVVLQLRPRGRPVDVRHHNLWAIGAEILMREGEESTPRDQGQSRRWGSAANLPRLKAYFDALIQRYPYDYRQPRRVCALDFWIAMLGCEIYDAHSEQTAALERLERLAQDGSNEAGLEDPITSNDNDEDSVGRPNTQKSKMDQYRDQVRINALEAMQEISERMDKLAQDQPYAKNHRFLELRATASLYIGDLLLPAIRISPLDLRDCRDQRLAEHEKARDALRKIQDTGGELDHQAMEFLAEPSETLEHQMVSTQSALLIG